METIGKRQDTTKLPVVNDKASCDFNGYDADYVVPQIRLDISSSDIL